MESCQTGFLVCMPRERIAVLQINCPYFQSAFACFPISIFLKSKPIALNCVSSTDLLQRKGIWKYKKHKNWSPALSFLFHIIPLLRESCCSCFCISPLGMHLSFCVHLILSCSLIFNFWQIIVILQCQYMHICCKFMLQILSYSQIGYLEGFFKNMYNPQSTYIFFHFSFIIILKDIKWHNGHKDHGMDLFICWWLLAIKGEWRAELPYNNSSE